MSTEKQPISTVSWVDPATLHANNYNPNRVFSPELALLKTSLLEDGWTQPIVAKPDGEIVDGFHRWTLGSTDEKVRAMTGGLVPVVRVDITRAQQMLSTVRHNRARGQHGVLKMADIVRALVQEGLSRKEIQTRLGMEKEEVERLVDARTSPDKAGMDSFGRGWVPADKAE